MGIKHSDINKIKSFLARLYEGASQDFHALINAKLLEHSGMFIITANPEFLIRGIIDEQIASILNDSSTCVLADGIGVLKAGKIAFPHKKLDRITGVDTMAYMLERADKLNSRCAFLGAKPEVLQALKNTVAVNYPNIQLVAAIDGFVADKDAAMQQIIASGTDMLFVALGMPAQELLLNKYRNQMPNTITMGVGGSFDVLSGSKKRAPAFFVKCNLEWLYRILKEPGRIKRFTQYNLHFLRLIVKLKAGGD